MDDSKAGSQGVGFVGGSLFVSIAVDAGALTQVLVD